MYTDNTQSINSIGKIPTKLNELISKMIDNGANILNAPSAEQIQNIDWSNIGAILQTISILLIVTITLLIGLYLLKSIALYVMCKKQDKDFAWLSFVPFGCLFTYGIITGKTKIFGIEIDHPQYLLPALFISSCLPFVGGIGTILFVLAYFSMLYRIYQLKTPNFAFVLLILSIIIPFISPIVLFAIRNK